MTEEQRAKIAEIIGPTFAIAISTPEGQTGWFQGSDVSNIGVCEMLGGLMATTGSTVSGTLDMAAEGERDSKDYLLRVTTEWSLRLHESHKNATTRGLRVDDPRRG